MTVTCRVYGGSLIRPLVVLGGEHEMSSAYVQYELSNHTHTIQSIWSGGNKRIITNKFHIYVIHKIFTTKDYSGMFLSQQMVPEKFLLAETLTGISRMYIVFMCTHVHVSIIAISVE